MLIDRRNSHHDSLFDRCTFVFALLTWFIFLLIAVFAGALRDFLLLPWLDVRTAHQIETLLLCAIFAAGIIAFVRHFRPAPLVALGIGVGWTTLTIGFEFGFFHGVVGHPISELLADYDLASGRLWPLVLFTELLTPWLAARFIVASRPTSPAIAAKQPHARALPDEYRRTISREEIAQLPIRRYEGEMRLVNTPAALASAMQDIRHESILGFDTETRPAFTKGERYFPSLVQVATARCVYLFQLQQLDCANAMAELLSNPRIVKAGVALAGDLSQLKELFPFEASAIVDIGLIAKHHGNPQTGLRNLAALFLGWRIAKGARTTNWSAPHLTAAQIGYAATDAWVSRELYLCFERLGLIGGRARRPHA